MGQISASEASVGKVSTPFVRIIATSNLLLIFMIIHMQMQTFSRKCDILEW